MTTYQAIPNAQIDQDSSITQDLLTLMRDNPIAGFEGSTDAPMPRTGWHGYDSTFVGDGNSGILYNNGGSVATIDSPAFEDGYEYRLLGRNLNVTSPTALLSVSFSLLIGGTYVTFFQGYSGGPQELIDVSFDVRVVSPRRNARFFTLKGEITAETDVLVQNNGWNDTGCLEVNTTLAKPSVNTVVDGIRFQSPAQNITNGQVFLLRRKEF